MARSLVRESRREAARIAGLVDRARAIGEPGYAAALADNAAAALDLASTVETAALYWVADPMARLAMDASQDVPVITVDQAPATTGLMVMAAPLPAWDTTAIGGLALRDGARTDIPYADPVPVDALTWHLTPQGSTQEQTLLTIELMCRPQRLPLPIMGHQSSLLVPFTRIRTLIPASLEGARAVDPAHVGVLAWLQAAWTLMTAPNLTQASVVATTGKPRTRTMQTPDDGTRGHDVAGGDGVTVIDLHPRRRQLILTTPDDGDSPRRRLTSRHVVRGHWTHQPHGPARSLRRLQWVDDYIRGPADAPLSTRAHVWAWRHQ